MKVINKQDYLEKEAQKLIDRLRFWRYEDTYETVTALVILKLKSIIATMNKIDKK